MPRIAGAPVGAASGDVVTGVHTYALRRDLKFRTTGCLFQHFKNEDGIDRGIETHVDFLFPGDMECAGFKYLLTHYARFASIESTVDVLIASHHGPQSGSSRT